MSFKFILFIIVQLAALVFFIEVLRRVHKRATEYNLKDDKGTVPFGFVKLKHIVLLYALTYLLWLIASIVLYVYFVQGRIDVTRNTPVRTNGAVELNL